MSATEAIKQKTDELLAFLPLFESEEFKPVKQWNLEGFVYPTYDEQVREFFRLLSRDPWSDYHCTPEECQEVIGHEDFIQIASMDQVRSLLSYCLRTERFCYGFWEAMFRSVRITALLKRLAELQDE